MQKIIFIALAAIFIFLPENAHAWGPGVHLAIGQAALDNLYMFPASVANLLLRYTDAFLYGCLSADIFIGKGTRVRPGHSHNWETGIKLLETAPDDRAQAYTYGYLTHLAADIVAHNHYVPNVLSTMPIGGTISHVCVEMLADARVDWDPSQALTLFRRKRNKVSDKFLLRAMEKGHLPFLLRKQLVKGSFTFFQQAPIVSRQLSRLTPTFGGIAYLDSMLDLATRCALHFLINPHNSPLLTMDPIGSRNLARATVLRQGRRFFAKGEREPFPAPELLLNLPALGSTIQTCDPRKAA